MIITTKKISIIFGMLIALVLLLASASITQAATSLFGGASNGADHVVLVSNTATATTTDDYSGISFDDAVGVPYAALATLSASYNVTDDGCGGGSPRFQIQIDTNGDNVSDGNVHVAFGPSPNFTNCGAGWQTTGNVIGNNDAGRYDYSAFGGSPFTTYSNMPASVASGTVRNISIVVDGGWSADASGGDNEQTVLIDNVVVNSATYSFTPAPAEPVTVTIVKYIDGVHAATTTAGTSTFPMSATWNSTSTGAGTGTFALGPVGFNNPNPYEATTATMTSGASYSTNEDTSGSSVGADCTGGKPFRLVGYSTGGSRSAAASSTISTTSPSFTNITTDTYVYVWNATCVPPTATTSLKVHILKYLDGQKATAASSSSFMFPMTSTWNSANLNGGATTTGSYVLGNSHGGASDQYGADTTLMDSPANYSTSEVTATSSGMVLPIGSACESGKYRLLGYKASAVSFADAASQALSTSSPSFWALNSDRYVIVLNETCAPTSPPTTDCAAMSTPAGYTRVNGTAGNDRVTLAPNTMFVGMGGNDRITGPNGNYIICTEDGNDTITLGSGSAMVDAGGGNNRITLGSGSGTITTGDGNDTVTTGDGDHTVSTNEGNDTITTGSGTDSINAGGGNNRVKSGGANDTIVSGSGNDRIDGGAGAGDTCSAGSGFNSVVNCEL